MSSEMWIIASVLVAAFLIMIPVQYRYISALKEDPRRQGSIRKRITTTCRFKKNSSTTIRKDGFGLPPWWLRGFIIGGIKAEKRPSRRL